MKMFNKKRLKGCMKTEKALQINCKALIIN